MPTFGVYQSRFAHIRLCKNCVLRKTATTVVVGEGSLTAELVIIGEAPGFQEDMSGCPFAGKSGNYLFDKLLEVSIRRENCYVTNILKCRPPDNRDPMAAEITACRPNLNYQLSILRPLVVVTVGRFALNWFDKDVTISEVHGKHKRYGKYYLFPLFHPAFIMRNRRLEDEFRIDVAKLSNLHDRLRKRRRKPRVLRSPK